MSDESRAPLALGSMGISRYTALGCYIERYLFICESDRV